MKKFQELVLVNKEENGKNKSERLETLNQELLEIIDQDDEKHLQETIKILSQSFADREMQLSVIIYDYIDSNNKSEKFEELFDRKIQEYIRNMNLRTTEIDFYNQNKQEILQASLEFFKKKFQYLKIMSLFGLEPLGEIAVFLKKYPKILFETIKNLDEEYKKSNFFKELKKANVKKIKS